MSAVSESRASKQSRVEKKKSFYRRKIGGGAMSGRPTWRRWRGRSTSAAIEATGVSLVLRSTRHKHTINDHDRLTNRKRFSAFSPGSTSGLCARTQEAPFPHGGRRDSKPHR